MKRELAILGASLGLLITACPLAGAESASGYIAADYLQGYNRSLFKHWVDADRNGCDTRAEVLISEAVVKPKVDKKCKISGGKWLSSYDGKYVTNASQLDVDHLVPLAEAWRSGAWAWTPKQRQDYANDLQDTRALIAVTLSTNRSKSDKDISDWVPKVNSCVYVENWIAIKIRYSLTYDPEEARALSNYFENCRFSDTPVIALSGYKYQSETGNPSQTSPSPLASSAPVASSTPAANPSPTISVSPSPSPTPAPTTSPVASPTPVATRTPTVSATPSPIAIATPTPTQTKPAAVKYKNCTEARAAGVTPIRKTSDPELYALNTALDGDKDGDACE